jgi:hypothetical protein
MLCYAVAITRRHDVRDELNDKRRAIAKYWRQSLFLLVPLVVPVIALKVVWRRRKARP